jgi:hypothetical protein
MLQPIKRLNVIGNILGNSGVNIAKQKQWKSFSPQQKNILRKKYPDTDRDGVPDKWDCQSRNPFRQDDNIPINVQEHFGNKGIPGLEGETIQQETTAKQNAREMLRIYQDKLRRGEIKEIPPDYML